MFPQDKHSPNTMLDMGSIDFFSVFDQLDDGVIITSAQGTILYYNQAQSKIDGIPAQRAIGMKATQVYDLNNRESMIMKAIRDNRIIKNTRFLYRTHQGKVVNSITSVYPLYNKEQITGAICFVKDYALLQQDTPIHPRKPYAKEMGNGTQFSFSDLVGSSPGFRQAIEIAKKAAISNSPIMIQGETGTGKELFAQAIHNHGPRGNKKFVAVNCAAIPHDLLEGMLFGTSRGAFTGAVDKPGLFELAHGSTLFLDELLAMPILLQAKLLRVLQEKQVRRVGSLEERAVDVKIISAANGDPLRAIREDRLRRDIYYRLGVVMVQLPPLRDRRESMEELAIHFLDKYNARLGTHVKSITQEVMDLFSAYHWPGNIRELEHLIEGAMNIAATEEAIGLEHFGPGLTAMEGDRPRRSPPPVPMVAASPPISPHGYAKTQKEQEQAAVKNALIHTRGNVSQAAQVLGISRQVLHYKMKKYGFRRVDFMPRRPLPVTEL
ncbi:MAG: sigma 54-interacting transcriptional regulator [Desulfovibrionales bacterium]|nr:sigma 54-interacting transcriptional regulator [Desulfovibrionales bacterium]